MAYVARKPETGSSKKKKDPPVKASQAGSTQEERSTVQKRAPEVPSQAAAQEQPAAQVQTTQVQTPWEAFQARHGKDIHLALYDLDDGQKAIEKLESDLRALNGEASIARAYSTMSKAYLGMRDSTDFDFEANAAAVKELERKISQRKALHSRAKRYQERIACEDTENNADFDQHKDYVPSDDPLYNWINDPEFREAYEAKYSSVHSVTFQDMPYTGTVESPFLRKGYDRMDANEIAIYNYYYATEGKEAAQAYLDCIQEILNERIAADIYGVIEDNTALEIAFGVPTGVDRFGSGVKNFFNTGDDYIPQSPYQIAGAMAREGLSDAGPTLPDWLGGVSLGQAAYDLVSASSYMAPSVLVSVATGLPMAGNALMGISAAGNAYQQALNEGFDKDQARGYSILIGASEMVMEKFLGGISAVGGNTLGKVITENIANLDTALKMVAQILGGSISEFGEEYLQEVLDPFFRNIMLKTEEEVELLSPEALYSGIIAALIGDIAEGVDVAVKGSTAEAEVQQEKPAYRDELLALAQDKVLGIMPNDRIRINAISTIEGMTREDAAEIFNILISTGGQSVEMDALGAREAYLYGYYGIPDKLLTGYEAFHTDLTEAQQQAIYEIGQRARDRQLEAQWQKAQEKKNAADVAGVEEVVNPEEEILRTEEDDEVPVEKTTKKDIMKIKNSELANGLPIKGTANSTVDKTDDSGKTLQRRIYGDDGMAMIDVDTSDHGLPKAHPYGAHKHVFDYSKKRSRGNPQPFTEEELVNYEDIIQKGVNYHDQR